MLYVLWLAIAAVIVYLDQLTKWLSVVHLKGNASYELFPGILQFTYVENRGAAFGLIHWRVRFRCCSLLE